MVRDGDVILDCGRNREPDVNRPDPMNRRRCPATTKVIRASEIYGGDRLAKRNTHKEYA